jgi:ABC-type polysaccharide/polyol phosphate export permease
VDRWRTFGLLVKGSLSRELLRAPLTTVWRQLLLPVGVVAFFTFVRADAAAGDGWAMIAVAGAIWLLFANSLTQAGMVLWNERRLLQGGRIPPVTLLAAATPVPLGLFAAHVALIYLALGAGSSLVRGVPNTVVLAGGIAAATGLAAGVLAARLCALRPGFTSLLPAVLLVSLILTPVFYRAASLKGIGQLWCTANPLCAAVELARAGFFDRAAPSPPPVRAVACAVSAAVLVWALWTLRERASVFRAEHG